MMMTVGSETHTGPFAFEFLHNRWMPTSDSPRILLTDNNPFSTAFTESVQKALGCKHVTSFTYYPQGNSVNESSHRLLEHALLTQFQIDLHTFEYLLQNATAVHNSCPHETTGESSHKLAFGTDMVLPGLELLATDVPEEQRTLWLTARKQLDLAHWYLWHHQKVAHREQTSQLQAGDVVIYKLPTSPAPIAHQHASGVPGWRPKWSLPHRVTKVRGSSAELVQLWTKSAAPITRPATEIRKISSRIPWALRQLTERIIVPRSSDNTAASPALCGDLPRRSHHVPLPATQEPNASAGS